MDCSINCPRKHVLLWFQYIKLMSSLLVLSMFSFEVWVIYKLHNVGEDGKNTFRSGKLTLDLD